MSVFSANCFQAQFSYFAVNTLSLLPVKNVSETMCEHIVLFLFCSPDKQIYQNLMVYCE